MAPERPYHVIIPAAGQGTRLKNALPKAYARIGGKAILRHTLENVLSWPGLISVRVAIDPTHDALYRDAVSGLTLPPPLDGGKDRKNSVYNALKSIINVKSEDIILIHDAARPLVEWDSVQELLDALDTHRTATPAVPVADTLRQETGDFVNREGLWAIQTPQAFRYGDLIHAHEHAPPGAYTDDTALVSAMGIPVKLVPGARSNIKITTPEDLRMAERLLGITYETRTGTGFDVHAFEAAPTGRPLMLCGITVPHSRALAGHSDADVALHALTDALLGALGAGDIGQHFPPSNPAFKDMDSALFLQKALDMLRDKGGTIQNLDLTLICEDPKIGPHRAAMKTRIAEICRVDEDRVNVKATTTEGLGFTGRREGIAAQAVATVRLAV
ncbi:MAG: bifunctional 2-C-methyl-D-erythritol 4-phosphate cytidylyltransferase/2-C-methyl-D-erythritol 2,4-cyclodiphosphate synthase [Alphaproteobacteria bacterium]|nr:bifunctional 2-C-methyl-D-erythritol 4-phosphate cytidylyltransferase/2-C-methyl-D-erythritol 2,4-cyclodiphosphate synthase [Alphaproteobacteria bacterium]